MVVNFIERSNGAYERIERVSLQHLDLICAALGCDLSEIIVWELEAEKGTSAPKYTPYADR